MFFWKGARSSFLHFHPFQEGPLKSIEIHRRFQPTGFGTEGSTTRGPQNGVPQWRFQRYWQETWMFWRTTNIVIFCFFQNSIQTSKQKPVASIIYCICNWVFSSEEYGFNMTVANLKHPVVGMCIPGHSTKLSRAEGVGSRLNMYIYKYKYIYKDMVSHNDYLSICLSIYLSICLSVCLSVCLSIYLSIYLSICIYVT